MKEVRRVAIGCKVCDKGSLMPRKKHRLSGPVVVIGYILLIPSILGIIFSATSLFLVSSTARPGSEAASGIAGGIFVFIGIAFFVGGLLGWLLIMKKSVLQCNVCGAVINAA
jgi:hypothetical protein